MEKAVVYGAYGMDNLGDNYMMSRVDAFLKKNSISPSFCYQGDRYYFEEIGELTQSYDVPFKKSYVNAFVKCLEIVKWYFRREEPAPLIFMGGGYTNERFGLRKLIFMNLLARKHRAWGVYFAGQTVGPYRTLAGRFLLDRLYAKGSLIFTRESVSHSYLTRRGITNIVAGDDAFLDRQEARAKKRLTLVTFKHFYGYERYRDMFFTAVTEYARQYDGNITVIPFMSVPSTPEYRLNNELYTCLKRGGADCSFTVPRSVDALDVLFRDAEAVITSAYHGAVLGYKFGCKVIGLYQGAYYRVKMKGIARLFHREKSMLSFSDLKDANLYALMSEETVDDRIFRVGGKIARDVQAEWLEIARAVLNERF